MIAYISPLSPDNVIYSQNIGKSLNWSLKRDLSIIRVILMQPKLCCGWEEADSKNIRITQSISKSAPSLIEGHLKWLVNIK